MASHTGHHGALWPPLAPERDHVDGPASAAPTLLVFGAYATPWSRRLGEVLDAARLTTRVAWRHYPDETAHPHAFAFALAAEAAATRGKFWVLTRELLKLRHDDPQDLHDALVRAGLDPEWTLEAMRARTGAERIDADVASARASGVAFAPTLFVNGERYRGELDPAAITGRPR
ncbi:thioredoxin domain-containing protein [Solirubrobacter ginsenosidimutans]|uniref:Thioredoxin domain-containing protein n=1 Tax=Solirubrobacter ginsenosidimutans TaxID=490573 RepID=A0A9X3S5R6_9ACTN|nr:thioredoxin domain-containing protein [Solirubrobacter ginsenosidimutans]MDA0164401.1 thioredoxin domain-containing protein [Solirubrobacter ginsenosidimutans]